MKVKEKRFLDALESLFTGARVDGDSGFVNLMRMKHAYFQSIRPELMEGIDRRAEKDSSFREELFDKLYTFFNRYFCESGSIYFRHIPAFSKTYERVYADGQDVALSWKTSMLYYVKSDVLVRSMPVALIEEGRPQSTRHFYFDASEFEHKKNNERREFIFAFGEVKREKQEKVVHLKVSYSSNGAKTKNDEIVKQSRKAGVSLTDDQLQKAISVFRRQTEADFFINKDARGFLREQFDLWLYQYMFNEETIFEQKRLDQIQTIKETACNIIDFIAQFEDELRRVWEKPKFVRNVNYVVTLDKLTDKVLKKITEHEGVKAQIEEWRELGMVKDKFSMKTIFNGQGDMLGKNGMSGDCKFLPLDTKHFKDLEMEILASLGNLDEVLDGELVHSENWQALNTLQKRYKEKVKCIYIDPPYNTSNDGFIYRDKYKHGTWLSMMENRAEQAKTILGNKGTFWTNLDDGEMPKLRLLWDQIFGQDSFIGNICWKKTSGDNKPNFAFVHDNIIIYGDGGSEPERAELPDKKQTLYHNPDNDRRGLWASSDYRSKWTKDERANLYYGIKQPSTGEIIYPDTHSASLRVWGCEEKTHLSNEKNGLVWWGEDGLAKEPRKKRFLSNHVGINIRSIWNDAGSNDSASQELRNLFGIKINDRLNPKPKELIQKICSFAMRDKDLILDYFAGSGTTAHAVINLNREDEGNRKYLLIEMGEYFHTVLLPRIKKVVYSKDWRDGKPVSREGSSHLLKYYSLEQYEETLKNSHYGDGQQLELDSTKSPFAQYVFFGDDKLAHVVKRKKGKVKGSDNLEINLHDLYPDMDIAESLSNILGKPIRKRTADAVTFADGATEKINPMNMNEKEKQHFVSLIKPYLWWGEWK